MLLAKRLLETGATDANVTAVLKYLEDCRYFWDRPQIDEWQSTVRKGKIPDFGANLGYGSALRLKDRLRKARNENF